ncbi:MAG: hypothetical protein QXO17_03720 [Nitrososphaerota archaeon]
MKGERRPRWPWSLWKKRTIAMALMVAVVSTRLPLTPAVVLLTLLQVMLVLVLLFTLLKYGDVR